MIANTPVGTQTSVDLIRDGKPKTLTVTLAKRDDDEKTLATQSRDNDELGIEVTDLDSDIARRFGIESKENGVLVTDVKDDSLAREADVRPGDIIKEINRTVVKDRKDFVQLMKKNEKSETIQLLVKRRNAGYLVVKIERK
jgi:S1-C subfamily serine protease